MFGNPETRPRQGAEVLRERPPRHPRKDTLKDDAATPSQSRPRQGRQKQGGAAVCRGRVRHHLQSRINKEGSILEVGIEHGVVDKKGAWLQFEAN